MDIWVQLDSREGGGGARNTLASQIQNYHPPQILLISLLY